LHQVSLEAVYFYIFLIVKIKILSFFHRCGIVEAKAEQTTLMILPITDKTIMLEHCLVKFTEEENLTVECPQMRIDSDDG
jgi:hypothetical protein